MPSICAVCQETFPNWMCYHMHMELNHKPSSVTAIEHAKRNLIGVKEPLTAGQRAAAVERCEHRLGDKHFYGGK